MARHGYDFVRDLIVAILALVAAFVLDNRIAARQEATEDRRVEQQEILENLRFVRDRAEDPVSFKPFQYMQLAGANLSGLNLGCEATIPTTASCTDLQNANLKGAILRSTDLSGAHLGWAHLTNMDASLAWLMGADMSFADLNGANLSDAKLEGPSSLLQN
jgi:uncharacterized protein YjbI with pentapeptide repeats